MKLFKTLTLLVFSLLSLNTYAEKTFHYKEELELFQKSPSFTTIPTEQLAISQSMFSDQFKDEIVIVSKETMPSFYSYIDTLCKEQGVLTPAIYTTKTRKNCYNTPAASLREIAISMATIYGHNDAEIEAIIAHEIGHIKYNHVKKICLIKALSVIGANVACNILVGTNSPLKKIASVIGSSLIGITLIAPCIINKRFEKQADEFAYKTAGKAEGFISFFECESKQEEYASKKSNEILQSISEKKGRSAFDILMFSFFKSLDFYRWLAFDTPLGSYPRTNLRVKAAKDYLASQQDITQQ
jgi:Zn-dependent protease with chaperone function